MSSASAESESSPVATSSGGDQAQSRELQSRAIASPEEKRGLLQELASVFMDAGADAGSSIQRDINLPREFGGNGGTDHAQEPRDAKVDEHLLQAMQRLSVAVERNSTELGEFRATQQRLQEQTLEILARMVAMKGGKDHTPQCQASAAACQVSLSNVDATRLPGDCNNDLPSFNDNADKNVEDDEDEQELPDQSQVLERKRDRLDGLEVYAVVSAISAGTMVAVFDSYQPSGAGGGDVIDLFHHGKYLEFLMSVIFLITGSIGIVCALHCIFVFSLVTMYGRTAIGMDRDDALDIFFAGTGIQRFHGFKTFVGSLYALMFELIVVITSKVSDKPFVHLVAIAITSRLMYNVYSDTQIIMDKATVIFAPRPQSSSDSEKDDDASLSLSLGSTGNKDDDESIALPDLISEKQHSPTDTTLSTSVPTSLNLRNSASLARRSSARRLSGLSSMNLGAEELIIQEQQNGEMLKKSRAKVLVVDDSSTSRRLLVKRVEKLDHVADQAVDGEDALKMLRGAADAKPDRKSVV